jgi:hypothetical protein
MHDDRSHHVGAHYGFRTDRYCLVYFYNDGLDVPGCSDERYPPEVWSAQAAVGDRPHPNQPRPSAI